MILPNSESTYAATGADTFLTSSAQAILAVWSEAMREHEAILDALRRRAGAE